MKKLEKDFRYCLGPPGLFCWPEAGVILGESWVSSTVTTIFWVYLLLSMIQLFLLQLGRADTSALYDINPAAAMPDDYFSKKESFSDFLPNP